MAISQLNVRIDQDLKAAGDAVLERYGVSAVQVIREAWRYMADHQRIPRFGSEPFNVGHREDGAQRAQIESQAGMALRLAREAGLRAELDDMTYEQLRNSAYEELLEELEERRA